MDLSLDGGPEKKGRGSSELLLHDCPGVLLLSPDEGKKMNVWKHTTKKKKAEPRFTTAKQVVSGGIDDRMVLG